MKRTHGRLVDVVTAAELDDRLAAGARDLHGWRLRGLDLRGRGRSLVGCHVAGATFLGCTFDDGDEARLEERGALVLPVLAGAPVDVYRGALYSPDDLYDAPRYRDTLDARAYAWAQGPRREREQRTEDALARTLHDHAVDEALARWREGRRLVGVMGGHAAERGSPGYRQAAALGHRLSAVATVATGGGPGAMEAANLGALLAHASPDAVDDATTRLAAVPGFRPSVEAWLEVAQQVRAGTARPAESLGVPTWHYGHEPPNVFATAIAKFFGNPLREALLLEVCDAGIVFLPGAAGTVQEVFQDACENYYAEASTVAPMVLVGHDHWTRELPAWPLLRALAQGRAMEPHVHLVDTLEGAVEVVAGYAT